MALAQIKTDVTKTLAWLYWSREWMSINLNVS